jgi:hypothetical protein
MICVSSLKIVITPNMRGILTTKYAIYRIVYLLVLANSLRIAWNDKYETET